MAFEMNTQHEEQFSVSQLVLDHCLKQSCEYVVLLSLPTWSTDLA